MIEIDLDEALRRPGTATGFAWSGEPEFEHLKLSGPLHVEGTLVAGNGTIRVAGSVEARLSLVCSRCLDPVIREAGGDFDEIFAESPGEMEDVYAYNRETKRISLDQMIYDMLSADIPLQVLCSEECRGLCPQCGHNLNEGPCSCVPEEDHDSSPNNPFAKLKDLF